jgi:protein-S-isoprenylcysteine O-methyltransferase Ste14
MDSHGGLFVSEVKMLIGRLFFVAVTCVIVVIAGGGVDFVRRPVGAIYLLLWGVWWTVTLLGRARGVRSSYDQTQRAITSVGIVVFVLLIVAPPWEYARFESPIPRDGWLAWTGLALFAAGIALQSSAMWALRGLYTSRLGVQPGHRIVTRGVYRWVRHPGYLSYIMSLTGIAFALSSLIALVLAILSVMLILWRIPREEEMLATEFGAEYQTYMQQTKWRLLPLVY